MSDILDKIVPIAFVAFALGSIIYAAFFSKGKGGGSHQGGSRE